MALCNSLSTMTESNLSILQSLKILAKHKEKRALKELALDLLNDIEHGDTLAKACYKQRKLLTPFFVAMINAGERSGTLDDMFKHLERYYTDIYEAQQVMKRRAMYPMLVLFIIIWVIPFFEQIGIAIFVSGQDTSVSTIALNSVLSFIYFLLSLLPYIIFLRLLFKIISMETIFIWFWPFAIPVRKMLMSRFSTAMSLLCKTSMKLPAALVIASRVTGSGLIEEEAKRMAQRIKDGETLTEAMRDARYFPQEHLSSIAMGEEGGTLDAAFGSVGKMLYADVLQIIQITSRTFIYIFIAIIVISHFSAGVFFLLSLILGIFM